MLVVGAVLPAGAITASQGVLSWAAVTIQSLSIAALLGMRWKLAKPRGSMVSLSMAGLLVAISGIGWFLALLAS